MRPVTIGHFTKIDPTITHLAHFRDYLASQLMMVEIDADTAVELAPYLKPERLEAMSNGDDYVPILPDFEVYRTHLSHGRLPSQVTTDVLGVKCAPQDAKLLGEFFTRMASTTSNEQRDRVFVPKGVAYLLGPQTYEQVLKENNFFLTMVASIPVNMEYDAWFTIIDLNAQSKTELLSLHDHLIRQLWFLWIESVARKKCLLVTTKSNLPEAQAWIDENLEQLIHKSIPAGIDPTSSFLPRRLDKPVHSASRQTYADILKKQFSLASPTMTPDTANNQPPRKQQAMIIDYDSDQSNHSPPSTTIATTLTNNASTTASPSTTTKQSVDRAAELLALKKAMQALRTMLTATVEQIKMEIVSMHTVSMSGDMETDAEHTVEPANPQKSTPDLIALIANLKHDIATISLETRAMFQKHMNLDHNHPKYSSIT